MTDLPARSTAISRAAWGVAAAIGFSVLALARVLAPDPAGFGTHEQLGLPPCGFRFLTSLPCPTCGLTTSFAHMARLQLFAAFQTHWFGPALFGLMLLSLALSVGGAARAWPFAETIKRLRLARLAAIIAAAIALGWTLRVVVLVLGPQPH